VRISRRLSALLATAAACGAMAASAEAAPVTVGSSLTAAFGQNACFTEPCTVVATSFSNGAVARSPVSGVIVRWRLLGGEPPFRYGLRVASPLGGSAFSGAGTGPGVVPSNAGLQTFPVNIPIQAGQMIGIDLEGDAPIGFAALPSTYAFFAPRLNDGETQLSPEIDIGELAFNADVQPAPAISAITPPTGSFRGGTSVTIGGADFTGASAVSFGGVPATSFKVDSETQITAVAPAFPAPTAARISVTTVAGTATSATSYEALACRVPKLGGKKLKAAKKRLRTARCAVGKVKKRNGVTAKTGKVVGQKPKPGTLLAPGAKVKITLG